MDESGPLIHTIRERIEELNRRSLFIQHLPKNFLLKNVATLFKTSINARFPKKKFKRRSKYVFVEFASADDANAALTKSVDLSVQGKPIQTEMCSNRMNDGPWPSVESYELCNFKKQSLQISCLPRETTEDDVKRLFPAAQSIILPNAGPGKAMGYARVNFPSDATALEAFESMHGTAVRGSPIVVNFTIRTQAVHLQKKLVDKNSIKNHTVDKTALKNRKRRTSHSQVAGSTIYPTKKPRNATATNSTPSISSIKKRRSSAILSAQAT